MKRKLGRIFARVTGVLRRVWRWFLPNPGRTEVQLDAPRPPEQTPTVTREVVDLEFEEIRAALAAEPSVSAAAPEARRRDVRPIEALRFGEVREVAPAPPPVEVAEPEPPVVAAPVVEETLPYKPPKYGREPKVRVNLAAPRPKKSIVEEPKAAVAPDDLEDNTVAELIARVDMFANMGDLPVAAPESVMAVEPELLIEEPPVRQQIVEQLAAEQAPEPVAEQVLEPEPVSVAPSPSDPWDFIASMRDGQPPPELVSEPVALAEVLPEPIEAAPEALAAEGFELPAVEEIAAAEVVDDVVAAAEPLEPVVEPSVEAVMAAEEAPAEVDASPVVHEETPATDAPEEAELVAEAAEVIAIAEPVHVDEVEAVAGAAIAEVRLADEPIADEPIADEPIAEVRLADEPIADEPIADVRLADEPIADDPIPLDPDSAMDAELEAAMAQAEDANTAFATSHPEAVEEVAVANPVDDDERIEDEPLSPPPVMADPYYEYAMAPDEPPAEQALAEPAVVDEPLPPEVAAMAVEEEPLLPPEVAAMAAEEPASLSDEATIDAVTTAVEETLAAADSLEAVTEIAAEMPADADALAAAAMADVVATAEAAEEEPPAPTAPFRNPIPKVETPTDYIATPESMHALYQLQLDGFEGPLDLLLHLIKRHHLDIFDIPIAFICERYLEYLKAMEDVDIDVASEFLFMAAELLQLKSRMLLPRPEGEAAEEEEIDPRAELVRRLLEYQKYKDVAERFGLLDRFGRDTFGREAEPTPPPEGEAPLKEVGLFALVKAFQACLDRQKPEVRHQVMLEQVSVRQRIRVLVQRFESQEPMRFEVLLEDAKRRIDIVVTFLALLEMGKLKLLRIFQNEDGDIYVHPKFDDVSLAFARLEGLDESQYAG